MNYFDIKLSSIILSTKKKLIKLLFYFLKTVFNTIVLKTNLITAFTNYGLKINFKMNAILILIFKNSIDEYGSQKKKRKKYY